MRTTWHSPISKHQSYLHNGSYPERCPQRLPLFDLIVLRRPSIILFSILPEHHACVESDGAGNRGWTHLRNGGMERQSSYWSISLLRYLAIFMAKPGIAGHWAILIYWYPWYCLCVYSKGRHDLHQMSVGDSKTDTQTRHNWRLQPRSVCISCYPVRGASNLLLFTNAFCLHDY